VKRPIARRVREEIAPRRITAFAMTTRSRLDRSARFSSAACATEQRARKEPIRDGN
jgi:hypothetical protein